MCIRDSQGVVLDLEVAGVGHRAVARVLDLAIVAVVLGLLSAIAELFGDTTSTVLQLIFGAVVIFGYPVVAEVYWRGRSIGKAAVGLRVVSLEAGPIGFREAVIRSLFQIIDLLASIGVVAIVTAVLTDRSQRLGDLAAGTFVLRDADGTVSLLAVPFTPPMGTEHIVAELDVASLTPAEERVIRSFLLRTGELSNDARSSLGEDIANRARDRLGHSPLLIENNEMYLAAVLAARQLREGDLAELAIE